MFQEILWLCMNSQGGISYTEAYHMPIAYRAINVKKISEYIKKRNEEIEKSNNNGTSLSMEDLARRRDEMPDFVSPRSR